MNLEATADEIDYYTNCQLDPVQYTAVSSTHITPALLVHKLSDNLKLVLHIDVTINLRKQSAQAQCRAERNGGSVLKGHRPLENSP